MTEQQAGAKNLRDKLGICQWFHYEAYEDVEAAVRELRALGVRHLRTGISWADFHRPGGKAWYDWQMQALEEFDVLLSIWHTPPSRTDTGECAGPPRRLLDYADFIGQVIDEYGHLFESLELWNEPNNRLKWNFIDHDPDWRLFGEMVREAGRVAGELGKPRVLGGMIPVDADWLALMGEYGVLDHVDAIAIHGFPDMWWPNHPNWDWYSQWRGWQGKVEDLAAEARGLPIWVTETGLATWDLDGGHPARFDLQTRRLTWAAEAPVERVYWYSLIDLHPDREAIEGFHVDENEYHLGLVTWDGRRKPAWARMQSLLGTP